MSVGLILLTLAYVLSQFYRAFLAVLAQPLLADVGAAPDDLAAASGLWFLSFAMMQIPVGWALDRVGPRKTAAVLLLLGGGGGAVVFAMASTPLHLNIAMFLIGIGCSPVLMASYYIFARMYPGPMFATLGAVLIGVGSLGNLASTIPLTWAVDLIGWREAVLVVAAISAVVAIGLWIFVQDPPKLEGDAKGSLLDLLRMPALWLIFPLLLVNYIPAGAMRGLWIGPYMSDVIGADAIGVGRASMVMAIAMIIGALLYGPMDRWLGTRKWVIFGGNLIAVLACLLLALGFGDGYLSGVILFTAIGFFGMSFPLIMAHGRAFIPPHLVGRGVTLLNFLSIGGVGLFQVLSGKIHRAVSAQSEVAAAPYSVILFVIVGLFAISLTAYLFSEDRLD